MNISITADELTVDLLDGRTISVPLGWYPRLLHGSQAERAHWRLIQSGEGIHWPDLDEDISVEGWSWAGLRVRARPRLSAGFVGDRRSDQLLAETS
jgi:hypothetical protein